MNFKCLNTLCLCIVWSFYLSGQTFCVINLKSVKDKESFNKDKLQRNFKSQLEYFEFINKCKEEGYLEIRHDSIIRQGDTSIAYMFLGPKYSWEMLALAKAEDVCSKRFNKQIENLGKSKFSFGLFMDFKNELLNCYDNSGRPFAKLSLSSEFDKVDIRSSCNIDAGPLIHIDSIINHGDLEIKDYILYYILNIKEGSVYKADKLYALRERLKKQRYIKVDSAHIVKFYKDKASLNLYLNNKKINYVNGVLGVFPDTDFENKLKLNGEMSVSLNNVIQFGEQLNMQWRAMDNKGQQFNLGVDFPVLLNNGLGAGANIEMFKKDTQFFNMSNRYAVSLMRPKTMYEVNLTHAFSNILQTDTSDVISEGRLPEDLDFVNYLYGLSVKKDKIKEGLYFNDPVGWSVSLNAGLMEIVEKDVFLNIKTDDIGEKMKEEYDSLNSNTSNLRLGLAAYGRILFSDRFALKFGLNTNSMFSNVYLDNEVFRIGGIGDIRGFNEGEIEVHRFGVLNTEIHFALELSSSIFGFFDNAYYSNFVSGQSRHLMGFGLGLSLKLSAGQLRLIYAYGKQEGQPVLWSNAKLHFGYINYF